jgi:YfiH family protein
MTALSVDPIVRSTLLSSVPGLVHGFTTRELGSMAGQLHPRDEQARNRRELASIVGMPLVKASQIHSADVVLVERKIATRLRDGAEEPISDAMALEADAIITREPGLALAVAVADCVPVVVVHGDWIGIAHAGWEGATKGVVSRMLEALRERGARGELRAAIGPSIGPCCYEIDGARARIVRERLGRDASAVLAPRGDGRATLDLWQAVRLQLKGAGAVDVLGRCTKDEVGRFFSHRGESGKAGRGLAFIGWAAA